MKQRCGEEKACELCSIRFWGPGRFCRGCAKIMVVIARDVASAPVDRRYR